MTLSKLAFSGGGYILNVKLIKEFSMPLRLNANTGKLVTTPPVDDSLQRIADSLEEIAKCLKANQ